MEVRSVIQVRLSPRDLEALRAGETVTREYNRQGADGLTVQVTPPTPPASGPGAA